MITAGPSYIKLFMLKISGPHVKNLLDPFLSNSFAFFRPVNMSQNSSRLIVVSNPIICCFINA